MTNYSFLTDYSSLLLAWVCALVAVRLFLESRWQRSEMERLRAERDRAEHAVRKVVRAFQDRKAASPGKPDQTVRSILEDHACSDDFVNIVILAAMPTVPGELPK